MIEFLLTVPLLLLIIFLIVTFGKGFRVKERAVVASRHATWHIAEGQSIASGQDPDRFRNDFFYGDATGDVSGVGADDGKQDYETRLSLGGPAFPYWQRIRQDSSGIVAERAAVDYVPTSSVYKYTLTRIGETTSREQQAWQWADVNTWRYFGDAIVAKATDRQAELYSAFDTAGQQGLAGLDPGDAGDPVLQQVLQNDLSAHRTRMQQYYSGWIGSWRRG